MCVCVCVGGVVESLLCGMVVGALSGLAITLLRTKELLAVL